MAYSEKVTVDRSYFEALLRRADFVRQQNQVQDKRPYNANLDDVQHTAAQLRGQPDPANVAISRVEYDSLLRTAREFKLLKNALFQGGIPAETLDLLTSGPASSEQRKDSGIDIEASVKDSTGAAVSHFDSDPRQNVASHFNEMPWRTGPAATFDLAPGRGPYQASGVLSHHSHLQVPDMHRHGSYGMHSSVYDDNDLDMDESDMDEINHGPCTVPDNHERRTLYISGFSERTSYKDLVSVIKGGKLLSISMRSERSATVSFLEGAADFLAWTKKNDIYLHTKRAEVKWADRQFHLNPHISNKIANGATRNVVIHSAVDKGLTESQIRDDMEHIHNLVIIDVVYRGKSAYVSMNSIHNALFARTCMMSRAAYKGCKIEFVPDECEVPLPTKAYIPKAIGAEKKASKSGPAISNRFDVLNIDGTDHDSDEENRTPSDEDLRTVDTISHAGVDLNFLDSDSV